MAKTGLWPQKFQPATIGVEELKDIAVKERHLFTQQFGDGIQEQFLDEVWSKTLEEVEAGILVGPLPQHEVPPCSERCGKVKCCEPGTNLARQMIHVAMFKVHHCQR